MKICFYLLFSFLIFSNTICFAQLDSSKSELNKRKDNDELYDYVPPKKAPTLGGDFKNELKNTIAGAIVGGLVIVSVGNYESEDNLHNPLSTYPYRDPLNGNYTKPHTLNIHKSIRFDIEDQFVYSNHNLYGNHLKAKLRPFQYFYFQSEMFQLFEYNSTLDQHSDLLFYNLDFCYDRFRFERFNLGFTAGANYIADDVKKGGFAFGFNAEIFVVKPISIYSSIKWSGINGHPVNTFEVQGKYHCKRFFASLGYQHLKIATPKYNFVSIGLGIYL
ncbi:MAG TPA: hypothetical protein VK796_11505 [Cytophaga sp.]|nr:hypothetical protein [Cytophaga sp.]